MPEFQPIHTDTTGDTQTCQSVVMEQLEVSDFVKHYLAAAEWTDCNADHDDPDAEGIWPGFEQANGWHTDAVRDAIEDCENFIFLITNIEWDDCNLFEAYESAGGQNSLMGHDFWLTRNGHGAGFWDRGLGKVGDAMSEAAKTFGSKDCYLDQFGLINFQ